jgi:hypothetical protein
MNIHQFKHLISVARLNRYEQAASKRSNILLLYRSNIKLSQNLFSMISMFEIILRNPIDMCIKRNYSSIVAQQNPDNWLRDAIQPTGIFSTPKCAYAKGEIKKAYDKLVHKNHYSHDKLVAELNFGFWRYMLEPAQFNATNKILLGIFPNRPPTTAQQQYNRKYIASLIRQINDCRNRIAHHETICLRYTQNQNTSYISTQFARDTYSAVLDLLSYMGIHPTDLYRGLNINQIITLCNKIDSL